ncbi:MAG: hypothetical protein Q8M37_01630 [Nevskia sp.]|nr:hypothetical protein [Nevskia sp.]
MLSEAFQATLKILLFRAGPADFPYREDPGLSRGCIGLGIVATAAVLGQMLPLAMALASGVVATAGLSMFVRTTLRLRGLEPRYVQTRNAMLASGSVLLLIMSLPMAAIMPGMMVFLESLRVAQEAIPAGGAPLSISPDQMPDLPGGASLLLDLLTIWFFAVTGHVLRQATNLGYFGSGLLALLCVMNVVLLVAFAGPLLKLVFGGGT